MGRKITCSLIGQAGILLALGVLSGPDAHARHLEPDEALSFLGAGPLRSVSTDPLKLAYTQESEAAEPAVYVFNRDGAAGFYVLAADDAVGDIVLGYSHTGYFSADNISPGLKWLLDAYSEHVGSCARGGKALYAPAEWNPVTPLISSTWAQTSPYNDMCPVVLGERAISGCVSVAVGQVMRKHQWPASGKGSLSYSYVLNGTKYDISSDFSKHTYDWNSMLDSYTGSSTQAQKNAVAQLVYDCGVIAQTMYIPDGYTVGSSGSLTKAAVGMIEHFDYDKSMLCLKREWFKEEDWSMMMYGQISQGLPVLYSGQSYGGGHAFVLDGCDESGRFHFNWGWGGYDDGYFLIDAIPYNMDQEAMVNVRRNNGSSTKAEFAIVGNLTTDRPEYSSMGDKIYFMTDDANGGFFSYSLGEVKAEIGVKNTADGSVAVFASSEFPIQTGFRKLDLSSNKFPKGEYDVYPVFRVDGGDWTRMKYNVAESGGSLHFVNDGTTIKVEEVEADGILGVESETISVIARNGYIQIEAPGETNTTVYDVAGTVCYSGEERIIPVEKNRVYIVVIGEKVFKVKS